MKAADLFDLAGQVALVTGASSGLGVRFAEVLAANGAAVVLVARRLERLETLKAKIEGQGGRALAVQADVVDSSAMRAAFDAAEKAFGTVTVLVNNAGIAQTPQRAVDLSEAEWRRVIATNLDAVFAWSREAADRMLKTGKKGSIINIASVLGLGVTKGQVAYSAAKAGVILLTKGLGLELAFKGIRVNAIAPGWVVTEMNSDYLLSPDGDKLKRNIPTGRFGSESDFDGLTLLLASGAGSYITGETIVIDGGLSVVVQG